MQSLSVLLIIGIKGYDKDYGCTSLNIYNVTTKLFASDQKLESSHGLSFFGY